MGKIRLAIILGSDSDIPHLEPAFELLKDFKISYELRILSAHRTPHALRRYLSSLHDRGVKVILAAAGGAAHLPGVIASLSSIPVIGIPIPTKSFKGIDSLLSILQMPGGVPVATMAVGSAGAKNGALFAIRILALSDRQIRERLARYKKQMTREVLEKDRCLGRLYRP